MEAAYKVMERRSADRTILLRRLCLDRESKVRYANDLISKKLYEHLDQLRQDREVAEKSQAKERAQVIRDCKSATALPPDQSARIANRLQNIRAREMRRSSCTICRQRHLCALFKEVGMVYKHVHGTK